MTHAAVELSHLGTGALSSPLRALYAALALGQLAVLARPLPYILTLWPHRDTRSLAYGVVLRLLIICAAILAMAIVDNGAVVRDWTMATTLVPAPAVFTLLWILVEHAIVLRKLDQFADSGLDAGPLEAYQESTCTLIGLQAVLAILVIVAPIAGTL